MRSAVLVMCFAARAIAAPTTVAVDVSRLEGSDASAIEQALVARLVQEGFAVVQLSGESTIVLTLTARDGEIVITAKATSFERSRTVDARTGTSPQLRLEVVQKAAELARLAQESIPPPPRNDGEVPLPFELPTDEPAEAPPREPRWLVGFDGGVLARGGGTDPDLALRARFAVWRDIGAALLVSGSQSSANGVAVRELYALAGISDDWQITRRLRGELSLVGGIRQHHFESTMPIQDPAGDRIDPAIALRARLGFQPLRVIEVSAWAGVAISKSRTHVLGTDVLWQRDATGIGGGLGVALRF